MNLRVDFLVFRFWGHLAWVWALARRSMAVFLFVSMRICKSRGRDRNDGVNDDDDDAEDDDDDDDADGGDEVEEDEGLGRDGANGGPTHLLARLQHQM